NVHVTRNPDGSLHVTWTPVVSADFASYNVYRAASPSGPFTPIISGIIGPEFTDVDVPDCGRPSYVVSSVDTRNNESAKSLVGTVDDITYDKTFRLTPDGTQCLRDIVKSIANKPRDFSVLVEVSPGDYSRCGQPGQTTALVRTRTHHDDKFPPPPYV